MKKIVYRILLSISICIVPTLALAARQQKLSGIGEAAQNLMEPVTILSNFIGAASIIIGVAFLFGAFVKYLQHRTNPLAVPLSTVITLFIMGIVLLCLPLSYKLTGYGIPLQLPF